MAYQGKTDWSYNDIVTEQDMNRIEQGIQVASDELAKKEAVPVTLRPGIQTITVDRNTPLRLTSIRGRTLVNLLGRDGNFENGWGKWRSEYFSRMDFSTSSYVYGLQGAEITIGSADVAGGVSFDITDTLTTDGYYIAIAEMLNGNGTRMTLGLLTGGGNPSIESPSVTNTEDFTPVFIKFQGSSVNDSQKLVSIVYGVSGQYGYVDGVRLYKITEAEYNALDSMTPEEIAVAYPYVDSLQNVNGVYIHNTGGNLLPTDINLWTQGTLSTSTGSEAENTFRLRSVFVDVLPNTPYTVSIAAGDVGVFQYSDKVFVTSVALTPTQVTFTTSANITRVKFILRIDNSTVLTKNDLYRFSPVLAMGRAAKPYQPQRQSYLYLPACQLASNADSSVADRMYMDAGKPRVIRQFLSSAVDGQLQWQHSVNRTGIKVVQVTGYHKGVIGTTGIGIKYNGALLTVQVYGAFFDPDRVNINELGDLYISISNEDSGWGPDYTPTADEIKAYFYGWKMYDGSGSNTTADLPYNRTDGQHKRWTPLDSFDGTRFYGYYTGTGVPTTEPTEENTANNYTKNRLWAPYLLQYQLTQLADEPLEYEGSLMLYEGANQIKIDTGVVVRERFDLSSQINNNFGQVYLADITHHDSMLKYRPQQISNIYKNQLIDTPIWIIYSGFNMQGTEKARIEKYLYDPLAIYQVTYLALDTYKLGIASTSISAEYAPNLRGTVDDLVQQNKDALGRISVLENESTMKEQPQWIAATLLNGWVNNTGNYYDAMASYSKIQDGQKVQIRGVIRDGITTSGTTLFLLPNEFIPRYNKSFSVWSRVNSSTSPILVRIFVNPITGEVAIYSEAGAIWLALDGIEYDLYE